MPPVQDIETAAPEITDTQLAVGFVTAASNPLRSEQFVRAMNALMSDSGLWLGHRLMTEVDLSRRLSVSLSHAKRIMNNHGDVQCGRKWRMSEQRFNDRVRAGKF